MITPQQAIERLISNNELFYDEMTDLMRQIMSGQVPPEQIAAILTGLNAPMLIKAIQHSPAAEHLNAFTDMVKEAAVRGIFAITAEPEGLVCKKSSERIEDVSKSS